MQIPVTFGVSQIVVGHLEIDEELLPNHRLKEMTVSWAFDYKDDRFIQMHLVPNPAVSDF